MPCPWAGAGIQSGGTFLPGFTESRKIGCFVVAGEPADARSRGFRKTRERLWAWEIAPSHVRRPALTLPTPVRPENGTPPLPRVSVIVPAYDATRWIGRTIESVLRQRYAEFEIVVIDDGSRDDLAGALAPYLDRDARIRLVRQDNQGPCAARNRGLDEARGDLVAPLDADDLWHPDFLAETVAALDARPDAPFAFAYYFRMDEADRLLFPFRRPSPAFRHDLAGLVAFNSVGCGSAGVYRRDPMRRVGGYDGAMERRGLAGGEDWKLLLRLARLGDPVLVERHLVGYRLIVDSLSQGDPRRMLDAVVNVLDEIRVEMPELDDRHFADGRTGMSAWLLPAFARQLRIGDVLSESWHAYGRNPLWFRNRALRQTHLWRVSAVWAYIRRRAGLARHPLPPLHALPFDGEYPFAFLAETGRDA